MTKSEVGMREWAITVTGLTMLMGEDHGRLGNFELRQRLNTLSRVSGSS